MKPSITKIFMVSAALVCGIFTTNVFATGECQDCYGGLVGYRDCDIAGLKGVIDKRWTSYACTNENQWIWKCPRGEFALVTPHATKTIPCSSTISFEPDVDIRLEVTTPTKLKIGEALKEASGGATVTAVNCKSHDGNVSCSCKKKCVSENTDCYCEDD